MADNTSSQGFASMPDEEVEEIARKGGQSSGGNPQNLDREARAKGGKHSHGGGGNT